MKALIAIAAMAVTNIASAAPQTIYFAGNIYDGTVVDASTKAWVPATVGGVFSGSITFVGTLGHLVNPPQFVDIWKYVDITRQELDSTQAPIVSSFNFAYGGITYSKLSLDAKAGYEGSGATKGIGDYAFDDQFVWAPQYGTFRTWTFASIFDTFGFSGSTFRSTSSRSFGLYLEGGADLIDGDLDLSTPPNLNLFDPTRSSIHFSNSKATCTYAQEDCTGQSVYEDGGFNIFGRLSYLSAVPLQASAVPEPGTLALVLLGLLVAARVHRRSV